MASDEQINNQERFNDLQRQSRDLLNDYNEGLLDSSDFVNVLTSRTSQLVDSIRDVNREKGKTLKADRDLTSSITKISDLTKSLSTPYNDMGKAIRDSSKATDLQARLSKDLALISEKINQEVEKGNRIGIIKFGSRVDLYLPENYDILVAKGQRVVGGETIISNPNNIQNIKTSILK